MQSERKLQTSIQEGVSRATHELVQNKRRRMLAYGVIALMGVNSAVGAARFDDREPEIKPFCPTIECVNFIRGLAEAEEARKQAALQPTPPQPPAVSTPETAPAPPPPSTSPPVSETAPPITEQVAAAPKPSARVMLGQSAAVSLSVNRFEVRGRGIDISYPNCNATIPSDVGFGIVGVNGGRVFTGNPCLKAQATRFSNLGLYVNTSYPGIDRTRQYQTAGPKQCANEDLGCIAYNYGYQAGLHAVDYARSQGVRSSSWWLDVETANSWTTNPTENNESLHGQLDAITEHASHDVGMPVEIGFYSVPSMWRKITGGWQNGHPNWVATGHDTAEEAVAHCRGREFTGGRTVMVQYVTDIDQNVAC